MARSPDHPNHRLAPHPNHPPHQVSAVTFLSSLVSPAKSEPVNHLLADAPPAGHDPEAHLDEDDAGDSKDVDVGSDHHNHHHNHFGIGAEQPHGHGADDLLPEEDPAHAAVTCELGST